MLGLVRTLLGEPGITELTPEVMRRARARVRKAARRFDHAMGGRPMVVCQRDGKCQK
jgi:hypothetical protein